MYDTSAYFRLSTEEKRKLKHLSVDHDVTLSEVLRRVFLAFLALPEIEQRQILNRTPTQELTQVGEER